MGGFSFFVSSHIVEILCCGRKAEGYCCPLMLWCRWGDCVKAWCFYNSTKALAVGAT